MYLAGGRGLMGCVTQPRTIGARDVARLTALIALWVVGIYLAQYELSTSVRWHSFGWDARAYWLTAHRDDLYGPQPGEAGAYLYSPAFAQAVWPIAILSWAWFATIWTVAQTAVFAWLVWPAGWRWGGPLFLLTVPQIIEGNVVAFVALAAVLGMRRPGFWAVAALTKPTLGVFGVVWFAARGEWRSVVQIGMWSAAVAAVPFALWPAAWSDWLRFLASAHTPPEVYVRTLLGVGLVVLAARRGWPWVIPVVLFAATPFLASATPIAYLAAIPRLRSDKRRVSSDPGRTDVGAVVGDLIHVAVEERVEAG